MMDINKVNKHNGVVYIYDNLPSELQNKIKYYVLEHPIARIIKYKIRRLRCDEYYTFKDKNNKTFCKVDGRDYFLGEYFLRFKESDAYSETSDEYMDEVFHRMFFVSSSSSSSDEE